MDSFRVVPFLRLITALLAGLLFISLNTIALVDPTANPLNTLGALTSPQAAAAIPPPRSEAKIVGQTPIITPETKELILNVTSAYPGDPTSGTVSVKVGTRTPINQQTLENWLDGSLDSARAGLKTVATETTSLKPTETLLTLNIPIEALPFSDPEQWGPRFLEVTFTPNVDTDTETDTEANANADAKPPANQGSSDFDPAAEFSARSLLLWDSGASFEPSPMMILTPLVTSARDMAATYGEGSDSPMWLPQRRLQELCLIAAKYPLTLAYDPLLLAEDESGETQATDYLNKLGVTVPTRKIPDPPAPEEPPAWMKGLPVPSPSPFEPLQPLTQLHQEGKCGTRSFFFLPPGDFAASQLTSLRPAEQAVFLDASQNLAAKVSQKIPDYQSKLILWPPADSDNAPDTSQFAAEIATWGARPLVLEDTADFTTQPAPKSYDLDARREVVINDTKTQAWALNSQFSKWLSLKGAGNLTELQTRQILLASTAVFTRQRPFSPRLLVLSTSRDYLPDASRKATLDLLTSARWLSFPDASELTPDDRATSWLSPESENSPQPDSRLSGDLRSFLRLHSDAQSLAAASQEPAKLPAIFDALAVTNARASLAAPAEELVPERRLVGLVKAQPVSVINLIDEQAKIPVSVTNGLDSPVTVLVNLKASDTRLQFGKVKPLTVPAGSTAQARIPVKAVGHGDVTVRVGLSNLEGQQVGTAETIQVRVRAEWESTGIYVLAGLLVVVLIFGIGRKIIKGTRGTKVSS